jgi:hypothetical protein
MLADEADTSGGNRAVPAPASSGRYRAAVADVLRAAAAAVGSMVRRGSAALRPGSRSAAVVARPRLVDALRRRGLGYAPEPDGRADPGEVVWAWVAYEDDPRQGKDRPVLIVGRRSRTVFGLMLSSQSDRDGQRHWLALGRGDWDRDNRPSWVRLDRVLTMREDAIRREGAVLDRNRFDRIAAVLRADHGWA